MQEKFGADSNIAKEFGVMSETVRAHRQRLGIPALPAEKRKLKSKTFPRVGKSLSEREINEIFKGKSFD
jgi:hypothetical protein